MEILGLEIVKLLFHYFMHRNITSVLLYNAWQFRGLS